VKVQQVQNQFTVGGRADELPSQPGLFIKNIGWISLPLSDTQAEKIIEKCSESIGKDDFSLNAAKNIFSLDSSQFEIRNPEWTLKLKELKKRVDSFLGCYESRIQPRFSLMLYRPGGGQNEQNVKGVNDENNLIVQLPSVYTGGQMSLHSDCLPRATVYHDFGQREGMFMFNPYFAAYVGSTRHQTWPVNSGNCLRLVYSLKTGDNAADKESAQNPNAVSRFTLILHDVWYILELIRLKLATWVQGIFVK
jgi:hypothetical protein